MDTRQQRKRMSSENRGQTGLGLCRVAIEEDDSQPDGIDGRLVHTTVDHRHAGAVCHRPVRSACRGKAIRDCADGTTGSPFFGSCLVAWGDTCDRRLRGSGIEGKYVVLNM